MHIDIDSRHSAVVFYIFEAIIKANFKCHLS